MVSRQVKFKECQGSKLVFLSHTVDGQNPAPPRMMMIPIFIGFQPSPSGAGFLPSTVCRQVGTFRLLLLGRIGVPVFLVAAAYLTAIASAIYGISNQNVEAGCFVFCWSKHKKSIV